MRNNFFTRLRVVVVKTVHAIGWSVFALYSTQLVFAEGQTNEADAVVDERSASEQSNTDVDLTNEAESVDEDSSSSATQWDVSSDGATDEDDEEKLETIQTPDIFEPSEDISEDYAVPFPVDI